MTPDLDIAVVGSGLAGLAAAHELRRNGHEVRVFETADAPGGRMRSLRHDGYVVDTGAEQISAQGYRATWQLIRRAGLAPEDVPRIGRPMAVWRDGRPHNGVGEPRAVLTGAGLVPAARPSLARFLGWSGRHRAALDHDHPEDTPLGADTVADTARRYHPGLHDQLLQPLASAFFGWDAERSAAAPLVGLLLAVGPVSAWRTYRGGMDLLARRLATGLDTRYGHHVEEVADLGGHARLTVDGAALTARTVVLAVPAPVALRLTGGADPDATGYPAASTYRPMYKVSCALDRPLAPRGGAYALLTPAGEEALLSCVIADHLKCPDRAPRGRGLISLLAAPHRIPELAEAGEDEAARLLTAAAERYVPGLGAALTATHVHHWPHGMPEITPRALALRAAFLRRPTGSVEYAGDWVAARPSSEGAARSGALAASRVLTHLATRPHQGPALPSLPQETAA
ncbi:MULTISPECIES: protoporphyrinogen/coproporphyrinogen oxidase [unclassified Streptomyces]|uniref:protoporphyrinogen/coproporphyrinogen oxidase n=1 Tax=unclassified Streptomyces TaxID=2593676 RepID=UPI001660D37C|nr:MULTISPECIES: NAD(P)/FAD-dependent oxidoreductase [unclassified Streptomyces]MBD0710643.1 amine oxidase [Streptomyces sp. CBMA291]MBD0715490.1 amine oxidase [Streptomyces sp. CBMA370]